MPIAGQGLTYTVDITLCIDATASMRGLIDKVKASALRFHDDLTARMTEKAKTIDALRVRLVAFRDFYVDGDAALRTTDFFTLPDQREACSAFLNSLEASGGGDEPENGLEALALAIQSAWSRNGDKRRHIIVVWTDASCHPLEKATDAKLANYPTGMPRSFDELTDLWEGQDRVSKEAKRLIVFAPDSYPWTDIANHWTNSIHFPSTAGDGLSAVEYGTILDAIANSV